MKHLAFTLIELLVVIAIILVPVGFVASCYFPGATGGKEDTLYEQPQADSCGDDALSG